MDLFTMVSQGAASVAAMGAQKSNGREEATVIVMGAAAGALQVLCPLMGGGDPAHAVTRDAMLFAALLTCETIIPTGTEEVSRNDKEGVTAVSNTVQWCRDAIVNAAHNFEAVTGRKPTFLCNQLLEALKEDTAAGDAALVDLENVIRLRPKGAGLN
jgi:hypothetical protein